MIDVSRDISYINYCRKSQQDKERQVMSLPAQRTWATEASRKVGHVIAATFQEERSAKTPDQRPWFDQMIKEIKRGAYRGIYTWKLDRLARNPEEAGIILGMLKRGEIRHIVTSDREYRPEDNALISYVDFGMADQYVRDLSGNVKRGLRAKRDIGWYPGRALLGYVNTKYAERGSNQILVDPDRFGLIDQAWSLLLTGRYSVPEIRRIAQDEWHLTTRPTKRHPARQLCLSAWYKIFTNPLYYGWFENPKGSGTWYQGKHKPMITEAQFETAQAFLGRRGRNRGQRGSRRQRFTYRGLVRCGSCPAMVTAERKVKRQDNGNIHRYIYYHCTRRVDPNCRERSIEERHLESQIYDELGRLRISDLFHEAASHRLQEDQQGHEKLVNEIRAKAQRRLADLRQQMDLLALRFTHPDNVDGRFLSDDEYMRLKSHLQKQTRSLESQQTGLEGQTPLVEEKATGDFYLAHRAQEEFAQGDPEAKRSIVTDVCSNLCLKGKRLLITLREPLELIRERRDLVEREIREVRTSKYGATECDLTRFASEMPTLCGLVHDVRTQALEEQFL